MSNKVKEIDIKNRTYYFFDDMINIKNKSKIDEKSCKNICIYFIGYLTLRVLSYATINSVKPLYLSINKMNGYIEESNRSMKNYATKSEILLDQSLIT